MLRISFGTVRYNVTEYIILTVFDIHSPCYLSVGSIYTVCKDNLAVLAVGAFRDTEFIYFFIAVVGVNGVILCGSWGFHARPWCIFTVNITVEVSIYSGVRAAECIACICKEYIIAVSAWWNIAFNLWPCGIACCLVCHCQNTVDIGNCKCRACMMETIFIEILLNSSASWLEYKFRCTSRQADCIFMLCRFCYRFVIDFSILQAYIRCCTCYSLVTVCTCIEMYGHVAGQCGINIDEVICIIKCLYIIDIAVSVFGLIGCTTALCSTCSATPCAFVNITEVSRILQRWSSATVISYISFVQMSCTKIRVGNIQSCLGIVIVRSFHYQIYTWVCNGFIIQISGRNFKPFNLGWIRRSVSCCNWVRTRICSSADRIVIEFIWITWIGIIVCRGCPKSHWISSNLIETTHINIITDTCFESFALIQSIWKRPFVTVWYIVCYCWGKSLYILEDNRVNIWITWNIKAECMRWTVAVICRHLYRCSASNDRIYSTPLNLCIIKPNCVACRTAPIILDCSCIGFIQYGIIDTIVLFFDLLSRSCSCQIFYLWEVYFYGFLAIDGLSAYFDTLQFFLCEYRVKKCRFACAVWQAVLHTVCCPVFCITCWFRPPLKDSTFGSLVAFCSCKARCTLRNRYSEPVSHCIRIVCADSADRWYRIVCYFTEIFGSIGSNCTAGECNCHAVPVCFSLTYKIEIFNRVSDSYRGFIVCFRAWIVGVRRWCSCSGDRCLAIDSNKRQFTAWFGLIVHIACFGMVAVCTACTVGINVVCLCCYTRIRYCKGLCSLWNADFVPYWSISLDKRISTVAVWAVTSDKRTVFIIEFDFAVAYADIPVSIITNIEVIVFAIVRRLADSIIMVVALTGWRCLFGWQYCVCCCTKRIRRISTCCQRVDNTVRGWTAYSERSACQWQSTVAIVKVKLLCIVGYLCAEIVVCCSVVSHCTGICQCKVWWIIGNLLVISVIEFNVHTVPCGQCSTWVFHSDIQISLYADLRSKQIQCVLSGIWAWHLIYCTVLGVIHSGIIAVIQSRDIVIFIGFCLDTALESVVECELCRICRDSHAIISISALCARIFHDIAVTLLENLRIVRVIERDVHIIPCRYGWRYFDVDIIVTVTTFLITACRLVLIILVRFALIVIEITCMIGDRTCLMEADTIELCSQTVVENNFLVVGTVALGYAEFINSTAIGESAVGAGCRCGFRISVVKRTGIGITIDIGMSVRWCTVIIFRTDRSFTGPYRIYSSLPVIFLKFTARIEVSVNVWTPVWRCSEVNIIVIAAYINCAVWFVPWILAASCGIACPIGHMDWLSVHIPISAVNLEVVAVILSAVPVLSGMEFSNFRTEIVSTICHTVVDTEMCCFFRDSQLVSQITIDTVVIACISIGFHQITRSTLSNRYIIGICICSIILEELNMDVMPYYFAVAVEYYLLFGRGIAFSLFRCTLSACIVASNAVIKHIRICV